MTNIGKAYGFFYCDASKEAIQRELPIIKKLIGTPSQLELTLTEGMDNVKVDERLAAIAQDAKQEGINYLLEAKYPASGNKETAEELANFLNQLYQTKLYGSTEPFNAAVVYEDHETYTFRE